MKIALVALTTVAVLSLLAYVLNLNANNDVKEPAVSQQPAPMKTIPSPQALQGPATTVESPTTPPNDNQQAIDSEIQGIDQALTDSEATLSEDVQGGELGL